MAQESSSSISLTPGKTPKKCSNYTTRLVPSLYISTEAKTNIGSEDQIMNTSTTDALSLSAKNNSELLESAE